jgi:hypothetical protein
VTDFDDPRRGKNYKTHRSESKPVLVPESLSGEAATALDTIELTIISAINSNKVQRFSEVERLGAVAQLLIQAVEPRVQDKDEKSKAKDVPYEEAAEYYDDEETYTLRPQMQRDYMETQANVRRSQMAASEAVELNTLLGVAETSKDPELRALAYERISGLKARLIDRTHAKEQENAVVHSDVSRRHPSEGEGSGNNDLANVSADAVREASHDCAEEESPHRSLGIEAVGHP